MLKQDFRVFEIEIHDLLFEKLIIFSHKKSAP